MKKSNLALIFAILCLFFPAIFIFAINVFGGPETINQDGYNYGAGASILLMLLGSIFVAIFGSILSFIAYNKNKPDLILYATILTIVTIFAFLAYPPFLIIPILLGVMGFISWKDVKRLAAPKPDQSQNLE
jgi:hypothetical protein